MASPSKDVTFCCNMCWRVLDAQCYLLSGCQHIFCVACLAQHGKPEQHTVTCPVCDKEADDPEGNGIVDLDLSPSESAQPSGLMENSILRPMDLMVMAQASSFRTFNRR